MAAVTKHRSFKTRIHSRKGQRILVITLFMFLPIVLLLTFTYIPFGAMINYSFYEMKYVGERVFVGFDNYIEVFTRDDCFGALKNSLYYMGGAIVQLVIALYLATVLSFKVRAGNLFKGLMFIPFLVNGIALGFIFKFFYSRGFVLDSILHMFGFKMDNLPYWLKDQGINNISLAATSVWKYFGQNMVLFIGAIMSVDGEMYEAATLDGANKFKQFIYIIMPNIKTIIILNVILSISGSISAFEPPYVITKGGVGTATYFVVMDEVAHVSQKVGLASAMAVVLLIIILLVTLMQKFLFKYIFGDSDSNENKFVIKRRERSLARYRRRHRNENREKV